MLCLFLDGDLVTVFDSQDLSFALQTSRVLKLQIFMNNLSYQERLKSKLNADELKKQLREIRDAVTWLLDTVEITNEGNSNNMSNPTRNKKQYQLFKQCIYFQYILLEQEPVNIASPEIPTDNGVTKEFDPLRNTKEERSKTPQTSQQVKCKYRGKYNHIYLILF